MRSLPRAWRTSEQAGRPWYDCVSGGLLDDPRTESFFRSLLRRTRIMVHGKNRIPHRIDRRD